MYLVVHLLFKLLNDLKLKTMASKVWVYIKKN